MTTATMINPTSGKEYTLTVHNHKAIGCSCNQKKAFEERYGPFAACMHMKEYNAPKPMSVDQFPTLDSCVDCGRLIKKGAVICARCLGC